MATSLELEPHHDDEVEVDCSDARGIIRA